MIPYVWSTTNAVQWGFEESPNPGELTVRPGSDVGVELESVPGAGTQSPGCSAGCQLLGYRVRLEVAADA